MNKHVCHGGCNFSACAEAYTDELTQLREERDRLKAEVETWKESFHQAKALETARVEKLGRTEAKLNAMGLIADDHAIARLQLREQLDAARAESVKLAEALRWIEMDTRDRTAPNERSNKRAAEALRSSPNAVEWLESVREMAEALANAMQVCTCLEGLAQEPIHKHTNPVCCMVLESRALDRFHKACGNL